MEAKDKAIELLNKFFKPLDDAIDLHLVGKRKSAAKINALITVDEIIKYHESLFENGFKEVHIAISSPIKPYNDILNPLLKYWQEVKKEIENL